MNSIKRFDFPGYSELLERIPHQTEFADFESLEREAARVARVMLRRHGTCPNLIDYFDGPNQTRSPFIYGKPGRKGPISRGESHSPSGKSPGRPPNTFKLPEGKTAFTLEDVFAASGFDRIPSAYAEGQAKRFLKANGYRFSYAYRHWLPTNHPSTPPLPRKFEDLKLPKGGHFTPLAFFAFNGIQNPTYWEKQKINRWLKSQGYRYMPEYQSWVKQIA